MLLELNLEKFLMTNTDGDDSLLTLRNRLAKALVGFESGLPAGIDPWKLPGGRVDPSLFPVPELVLFALRDIMGFSWSGAGEKLRWSVYATVQGEPFVFEQRKFGFAVDSLDTTSSTLRKRVVGQLSSALRVLEPLLQSFAKEQIADGNLTLENKLSQFENRYRYFRHLADNAFGPDPEDTSVILPSEEGASDAKLSEGLSVRVNRAMAREEEGYFASGAMVDAYFSMLEHRVLLLRAFIGRPLATGDFAAFLQNKWGDRLREVVDFEADPIWEKLLFKMRNLKATIRNLLAHGGVENDGGAFYFHMPRVGAIPANLSRYRGRLRTSFFPIGETNHSEICALFDEMDSRLEQGNLELPNEFVRCGIAPCFDSSSVADYAKALAGGAKAVDELIERLSYEWERHANYE